MFTQLALFSNAARTMVHEGWQVLDRQEGAKHSLGYQSCGFRWQSAIYALTKGLLNTLLMRATHLGQSGDCICLRLIVDQLMVLVAQ